MMNALETSSRALKAQQRGLDVTSNNIANVNTPGYTRQSAILSETDPLRLPQAFLGTGVVANDIKQYREAYLDREMRNGLSRQSGYSFDNKIFQQVQSTLNEPSDYGLDTAMDKFFGAVEQLSSKPDDLGLRGNLLSAAGNMTSTFNNVGGGLRNLRGQVYDQMNANVTQVNRLLAGIADLNNSIAGMRTSDGETSSTLLDKQNLLIEELSKLGDVQVTRTNTGASSVSMNGTTVVVNDTAMTMKLQQTTDPLTGEVTASINVIDPKGNTIGGYKPNSGEMASQMKFYNVTLDDKDSSGGFSIPKNINALASAIASKVNSISQTGYGLNDTGTTPPGRDFFTAAGGGAITAENFSINPALLSNPADIPTASSAGAPGNADMLLQIGQLINDGNFVGSQTARAFYGQTLTTVANIGADAVNGQSVSDATVNQISAQRESAVGVNIDEEAINMIKFQRAFEAAARMVSTTSEMMKTIVNLGA